MIDELVIRYPDSLLEWVLIGKPASWNDGNQGVRTSSARLLRHLKRSLVLPDTNWGLLEWRSMLSDVLGYYSGLSLRSCGPRVQRGATTTIAEQAVCLLVQDGVLRAPTPLEVSRYYSNPGRLPPSRSLVPDRDRLDEWLVVRHLLLMRDVA